MVQCQFCGSKIDKRPVKTGNTCFNCNRSRHLLNTFLSRQKKKNGKQTRTD